MDLRKLRDGNFCRLRTLNSLKTTVKTAVKSFTSVLINSLLLMRINAIRFLQSKWTINGQELKLKLCFFLLLSHNSLVHLSRSLYGTKVRFESSKHFFS